MSRNSADRGSFGLGSPGWADGCGVGTSREGLQFKVRRPQPPNHAEDHSKAISHPYEHSTASILHGHHHHSASLLSESPFLLFKRVPSFSLFPSKRSATYVSCTRVVMRSGFRCTTYGSPNFDPSEWVSLSTKPGFPTSACVTHRFFEATTFRIRVVAAWVIKCG